MAPAILKIVTKWRLLVISHPGRFTPLERSPVPTEYGAERAPEPVWRIWRREKFFAPLIALSSSLQPDAIPPGPPFISNRQRPAYSLTLYHLGRPLSPTDNVQEETGHFVACLSDCGKSLHKSRLIFHKYIQ